MYWWCSSRLECCLSDFFLVQPDIKTKTNNPMERDQGSWPARGSPCDGWADLLYSILGKFTNPKIGNHCYDMFGHVFNSVLLHWPCILFETTLFFTLGFYNLILFDLIFHWRHKGKMFLFEPTMCFKNFLTLKSIFNNVNWI